MSSLQKCPVCRGAVLKATELQPNLAASNCQVCGGVWIPGAAYWAWLDTPDGKGPHTTSSDVVDEAHDVLKAKLCPDCGKILRRFKVGRGLPLTIDRCAGCEGVWFDAREWDALRAAGLHTQVHLIVSPKWQAQVAEEERRQLHEERLLAKLGPQDLAEIKRIKSWIDAHPKRSELYALLLGGTEGNVVSYNPDDRPARNPPPAGNSQTL